MTDLDHDRPDTRPAGTDPARTESARTGPAGRPAWSIRGLGVIAGLVAAMVGLAVAELVAAIGSALQSPVLDVGDRVVDGVPNSVKELAIDWFGTKDKVALLAGIATLLAVYAAVVGMVAVGRRWRYSIAGIALFGLVGAYASQTTRREAPWYAVVPSLAGGAAAALALVWLRRRLVRPPVPHTAPRPEPARNPGGIDGGTSRPDDGCDPADTGAGYDRRGFLVASGATAAGAVVLGAAGRRLGGRDDVSGEVQDLTLPIADEALPTTPPGVEARVEGVSPFFTPNTDFYRIDTALTVPQVSTDGWQLDITGMVAEPLSLSYAELLDRELVEADITLSCVSNEVGGNLLGTARWLGVRLDDLLEDTDVDPDATQIVGRSVDGYTCGFPTAVLDGRDALVAIGMNDEPLPVEHGYPARLIVPGLYGYVSATKWLTEIELTTFESFDQYWVERGWVDDAPIKIQSRIDTPRGLATLQPGTNAIAGVAWAQTRGIEAVEVQIDDGDWMPAVLADELNDVTWRQWSLAWDADPGRHSIRVRAIERGGAIQTDERTEPFPSGATGRHQIIVIVSE